MTSNVDSEHLAGQELLVLAIVAVFSHVGPVVMEKAPGLSVQYTYGMLLKV